MYEVLLDFSERWGGVRKKIPSMGEVWIFSGGTQCDVKAPKCTNMPTVNLSNVNWPDSLDSLIF